MGDTKLKEAINVARDKYVNGQYAEYLAFLAGASYRDPEIKELLDIVQSQRQTLLLLSKHEPSWCDDFIRAKVAITATDQRLKELGVKI